MGNVPNRVFYDYDGTTVKDPFKTLGDAGVNAVRVEATRLGPTKFVSNASTLGEELTFTLDWGCIDIQIQTAQRGVAQGMESYGYEKMAGAVQDEIKRQIQPCLDAKVVPDISLSRTKALPDFCSTRRLLVMHAVRKMAKPMPLPFDKELCDQIPTGNMVL